MHERRNMMVTIFFTAAVLWGLFAFLVVPDHFPGVWPSELFHKLASVGVALVLGSILFYAYQIEDRLDDQLGVITMGRYYERDGLCFMPLTRVRQLDDGRQLAEISLYYQNRFDGTCEVVIHLRPPAGTLYSHRGSQDLHFAFQCRPGGYGVVHQPVAIMHEHQGEQIEIEMAAAIRWPRGRGDQVRSHQGLPCGTFEVDWALAYRQSHHELSGDIELKEPARVHMTLPTNVIDSIKRSEFTLENFGGLAS